MKLLIIADDFTGALDTGVQFAAAGAKTKVVVGDNVEFQKVEEDVLVVDTETRHLPAENAYNLVYRLAKEAKAAQVPYIYKKTDSALRGNIGAELQALADASEDKILPFLPAFPQMNRVTKQGIHLIDGVGVTKSPFGQDPFEPVKHDAVKDIIAEQSHLNVYNVTKTDERMFEDKMQGIVVFDAESMQDLEQTGELLYRKEQLHIMAGCAGFAAVLPKLLGLAKAGAGQIPKLDERFFVVCGSVNPITVRQVSEAENAGFAHIHLTPEQKLEPGYWNGNSGQEQLRQIEKQLEEHSLCILDSNDRGGNEPTLAYAKEHGYSIEDIRQGIAKTIGYLVGELFTNPALGTLFITGGDTLLQCMNSVGVHELEPVCEMEKGVVLSKFTYKGCSKYVISKSGGFGHKELLVDLAQKIASR